MSQLTPLALFFAFVLLAIAAPLMRLARRHGVWGVVRSDDPVQRVMVASLGLAGGGAALWTALLAWVGPVRLGVWQAPGWVGALGAALGALALGLVVLAQVQMGASWRIGIAKGQTGLVTHGVFRHIRHPIYTGLLILLLSLVLLSPSPWTLMGAGWLATLVALQARLEEAHLLSAHGAHFEGWAARAGRFIPGVGRLGGS